MPVLGRYCMLAIRCILGSFPHRTAEFGPFGRSYGPGGPFPLFTVFCGVIVCLGFVCSAILVFGLLFTFSWPPSARGVVAAVSHRGYPRNQVSGFLFFVQHWGVCRRRARPPDPLLMDFRIDNRNRYRPDVPILVVIGIVVLSPPRSSIYPTVYRN